MIRVLVEPLEPASRSARLLEGEEHHLKVRRVEAGEPVEAIDGRGHLGRGTLHGGPKHLSVELATVDVVPPAAPLRLRVGAGDRDRFLWLVEKATELGATALVPLLTERSISVANRVKDEHRGKLERRSLEALKQCGGAWTVAIEPVAELAVAVAAAPTGLRWVADVSGAEPRVHGLHQPATIIIGPEGGLTQAELATCRSGGFSLVRLASRVLRFETAAIAALALMAAGRRDASG
jgi:16S rRNA (uracil1498-N3)-methyltransferase